MSIDFNNYGAGIADRIDLFTEIDRIENDDDSFVPLCGDADDDKKGLIDFNLPTDTDSDVNEEEQYGLLNNDDYADITDDRVDYKDEHTEPMQADASDDTAVITDDCTQSDYVGSDILDMTDYNGTPDDDSGMPLSDIYNVGRALIHEPEYSVTAESHDDACSDITSANMPQSLDEIEQEIDRLKLRWSEVTYLIGQRLKYIADNRLYEQKGYHDFKTYVTLAIKMSENNAYYYISVFEYFTEEQTKRAGSKLKLIIPVLNKLKRDKTVSDELKAIKIKGMRDELYYKIYNKTYREAEKIITDMRQKYFTDIGKIVQFQRVRIVKDKIIINEKDPDIQQKLLELIEEFYE